MRKVEYEIRYHEENDGKPYIYLENGNMDIEDIFFCFEMVKYRMFGILNDDKNDFLGEEALKELSLTCQITSELSDKLGEMIIGSNNTLDDINDILNSNK